MPKEISLKSRFEDIFANRSSNLEFYRNLRKMVEFTPNPTFRFDRNDLVELDGATIKRIRLKPDIYLSQEELAQKTVTEKRRAITGATISNLETGRVTQTTRFNAARIASALGVSLDDILAHKE